jgi:hypothetical protein
MELALILLAVAVVAAAAILAFARRPVPVAAPDTRLDAVLSGQGDIAGQFKAAVQAQAELQRTLDERIAALDNRAPLVARCRDLAARSGCAGAVLPILAEVEALWQAPALSAAGMKARPSAWAPGRAANR